MKIGDKLYYHNKYYQVVFCHVVNVVNKTITVENEYGKTFDVPEEWIVGTKICKPVGCVENENIYLTCPCGCMRFGFFEDKLFCNDCGAEYNKEELDLLKQSKYIEQENKEQKIVLN